MNGLLLKRYFYRRLMMMFFYLLNLSIAVYLRPTTREPLLGKRDATSIVRYCSEIITCLGCVVFGIFQQVQEILAQGIMSFFVSLTASPVKSFFLLSCFLILSCIPCRVVGDRETEDVLLTLAIPCSWFYLIFFAGAVRLTGPFVTMIYSMIVGDMFRFSIIYTIFLFGFTQAFYFLFKQPPSEKNASKRFATYPITWMSLFHMTLGSYEYEEIRETYYQKLTQLVFAVFMVFTPILLLNMLIAMMGNTYCEVIEQSEKEWVKQWANIIVALEKAIDCKSAKEFLQTYSIKMPSPDKETEVRGVIVIKTKLKSKAKEKKQALSLWKRVGKRTIQELRKFGGKAAEVRKRYNLFRSKQPTARLRMGKVVQEWNPTPTPVYLDTTNLDNAKADPSANNAGFNDLLSQVTSASGIDIEKPAEKVNPSENKTTDKQNTELSELVIKPPVYEESAVNSNTLVNLSFEGSPNLTSSKISTEKEILPTDSSRLEAYQSNPTKCVCFDKMEKLQSNSLHQNIIDTDYTQRSILTSSVNQVVTQSVPVSSDTSQSRQHNFSMLQNQKCITQANCVNDYIMKMEPTLWEEPSNELEKHPQVNTHSEQFQTTKAKGISVSIQTRIMGTKITKSKIRRRKDLVFPLRNEYSDSTSEKEPKRGFLLYKKQSNGAGLSFRASNKYRRRRKRNQVAFQEKKSIDNVQYEIPVSTENR